MQQVFALTNSLLKRDDSARGRRLTIRTYKVVPLSQRSGILEWCENTLHSKIFSSGRTTSRELTPDTDQVRIHLLLIAGFIFVQHLRGF